MNLDAVLETARDGRLYPALVLYGGDLAERQQAALAVARTLLCERPAAERPCAAPGELCRHCRRAVWPEPGGELFHPDFHVLERDLRTSTSIDATRRFLSAAYEAPFEARGQVFVIAEAETLGGGAADSLLKLLEEPPTRSPRHFLLLAASRLDLNPTLRSRSLEVFLGGPQALDREAIEAVAEEFGRALEGYLETSSAVYLLLAAEALGHAGGWQDPRARAPWAIAAAAVMRCLEGCDSSDVRSALLALAEELLGAARWRVRGITAPRLLEGLVARHLAAPRAA